MVHDCHTYGLLRAPVLTHSFAAPYHDALKPKRPTGIPSQTLIVSASVIRLHKTRRVSFTRGSDLVRATCPELSYGLPLFVGVRVTFLWSPIVCGSPSNGLLRVKTPPYGLPSRNRHDCTQATALAPSATLAFPLPSRLPVLPSSSTYLPPSLLSGLNSKTRPS